MIWSFDCTAEHRAQPSEVVLASSAPMNDRPGTRQITAWHWGGVVAWCAHGAGLFRCFRGFYLVERPTTNHSGGCSQMLVDGHQRPLGDIWCFFLPCRAFLPCKAKNTLPCGCSCFLPLFPPFPQAINFRTHGAYFRTPCPLLWILWAVVPPICPQNLAHNRWNVSRKTGICRMNATPESQMRCPELFHENLALQRLCLWHLQACGRD